MIEQKLIDFSFFLAICAPSPLFSPLFTLHLWSLHISSFAPVFLAKQISTKSQSTLPVLPIPPIPYKSSLQTTMDLGARGPGVGKVAKTNPIESARPNCLLGPIYAANKHFGPIPLSRFSPSSSIS
jgi:hypothetical protein